MAVNSSGIVVTYLLNCVEYYKYYDDHVQITFQKDVVLSLSVPLLLVS